MHESGHQGAERECLLGSCPHADLLSSSLGAVENRPVSEGALVQAASGGIPASEEAVLGEALVGTGVLHLYGGASDRGDDQGVHR